MPVDGRDLAIRVPNDASRAKSKPEEPRIDEAQADEFKQPTTLTIAFQTEIALFQTGLDRQQDLDADQQRITYRGGLVIQ